VKSERIKFIERGRWEGEALLDGVRSLGVVARGRGRERAGFHHELGCPGASCCSPWQLRRIRRTAEHGSGGYQATGTNCANHIPV
jgi:hypothetical protein